MPRRNRGGSQRELPLNREGSPSTSGQDSPIAHRLRSRVPMRDREPEEQLPPRSQRRWNPNSTQRDRSRSPIDRNRPELESIQSPHSSDQQSEQHDACDICFQELDVRKRAITLNCSHQFHSRCIRTWLSTMNTCPICRENVYWNIKRVYSIPNHGLMTIIKPGLFWVSELPFTIKFINGEPSIHGLPGQDPIYQTSGIGTSLWGREAGEPLPQKSTGDQDPEECPECTICIEEIQEEAQTTRLPCSHQFHTGCISRWMLERNSCPVCRDRVTWHVHSEFNLPTYGPMIVIAPGQLWSRKPSISITVIDGKQCLEIRMPPQS